MTHVANEHSERDVPAMTVQRIPLYLRCLLEAQGERLTVLNSKQLGDRAGTNAAQVRKDLSHLGELGTRGIGYDVDDLVVHLMRRLGITESRSAALVGFGRLGSAFLGYQGFAARGVRIVAVFDTDPDKVGTEIEGLIVTSIDDIADAVEREGIELAILTVPAASAQKACDALVASGIKAILNFAPCTLTVPDDVSVRQADVAADLQILSFHLNRASSEGYSR
ncbi:MAG: redox-sensing transcriptional repressor Rex [Actinomycetota bacterium]|jgi:redox-sensing transcriptional repressor|nr:redox-sensing transcriptional repressor Rex [Actinomycetota bacterium]